MGPFDLTEEFDDLNYLVENEVSSFDDLWELRSLKLPIELVPATCWGSSLAKELPIKHWNRLRNIIKEETNYTCELCGKSKFGKGNTKSLHCHEIWYYDDLNEVQVLEKCQALCFMCHMSKHPGIVSVQFPGLRQKIIKNSCKINEISYDQWLDYYKFSMNLWKERSRYDWYSWVNEYLNKFDIDFKLIRECEAYGTI